MSADPHNLIQQLISALDDRLDYEELGYPDEGVMPLIAKARAYLAAPDEPAVPDGREPTDEELWQVGDEAFRCNAWPTDAIRYARAVLARYGSRTTAPILLAERQPTEADCDAEGRCWWWHPESFERNACWCYSRGNGTEKQWLPYWALSTPGMENGR